MAGVFKPITAKSITQHTAHKEYDLTFPIADKFATFDDVRAYYHSATSRNLVNGRLQDYPATDAVNSNGSSYVVDEETLLLDQDVYNAIRGKYIVPEFIPQFKGMRWSGLVSMSVFSLSKEHYGEGIKPGTVEIGLDGSVTLTDNGKGVLQDDNTVSNEGVYFHANIPYLENKLHSEMPFDWERNVDGADTSLVVAKGYNLNFRSNRHANGYTSFETGSEYDSHQAIEFSQSSAPSNVGLWKKSVKPKPRDASIIWLDRMPRTAFYHTDQFEGLSLSVYGKIDESITHRP